MPCTRNAIKTSREMGKQLNNDRMAVRNASVQSTQRIYIFIFVMTSNKKKSNS